MKRVLVNDRLLAGLRTGVGQYLSAVMAHWPADARVQLAGFHFRGPRRAAARPGRFSFPTLSRLAPVRLTPLSELTPPRPTLAQRLIAWTDPWSERLYARMLRRERTRGRYDGFFEPNNIAVEDMRPTLTTVFDLSVLELPDFHPPQRVAFWRRRLETGLRWTTHWACISQTTADAMSRVLGVRPGAMTVVPLASRWGAAPADWEPAEVRRRLGLPERYLVCLGTIEPRKNVGRLLDAYALQTPEWRERTPLMLVGAPGWGGAEYWRSLCGHPMARHALVTSYVGDGQAAAAVRGAAGLLYPSVYEGFGLPPLEAMALEVPVAASTAPAIREVCADAAAALDPGDSAAWADWMRRLCEPGAERDGLVSRGRARVGRYSWDATARGHHDLLDRMTDGP